VRQAAKGVLVHRHRNGVIGAETRPRDAALSHENRDMAGKKAVISTRSKE